MDETPHNDEFVKQLFDRMGPTYSITNLVCSFGFSELWRRTCVKNADISDRSTVCDMMAGSGECWRYIPSQVDRVVSIDFSEFMTQRQIGRKARSSRNIEVHCENAVSTSLADQSVDHIVSAFGLKTLSKQSLALFSDECCRILKPGGTFSFLEISVPESPFLRRTYMWYLSSVIPCLGKMLLGDIECYRLLGRYTTEFGSCARSADVFRTAGLDVRLEKHFFGCATSLIGVRKG